MQSVWACAENKIIAIVFGFDLLLPSCFTFLCPIFSSVWHLPGVILIQNVLGKFFRIVGLEGRKCRRLVEQDFHWNFLVNFLYFFHFSPVSLTELCSFWHIVSSCISSQRTKLSLTIKTDNVTSGTKDVGPHG